MLGSPPRAEGPGDSGPEMWIQYPHARREMVKELIFLSPCVVLGYVGGRIAEAMARAHWPTGPLPRPPLAVEVLAGVLLGYLIGAGLVWAVRIFGSLAFGKEAMGLGDVHLMGAVGVCIGWRDAVLAFFGAAFVGIVGTVAGLVFSGKLARAMPYGPYLAISTVLVILCRPLVERGMALLFP
jgi:leader peptidase (prepilin peptidase)/N-methyltransferase